MRTYRAPLVAIDRGNALAAVPLLRSCMLAATIVVLCCYGIPRTARVMIAGGRFHRALHASAGDEIDALVTASGLAPERFERIIRRGDLDGALVDEIEVRRTDLVILACDDAHRIAREVRERTGCEVRVGGERVRGAWDCEAIALIGG